MPDIKTQIHDYIASQPAPKQADLLELHHRITGLNPSAQLWFLDGKDENGKTVSNPNIGYGHLIMPLAGGKSREFYQVGISANQTGISVYIMGLADKTLCAQHGKDMGAHSRHPITVSGWPALIE